jgi:DnaK suppressor protein
VTPRDLEAAKEELQRRRRAIVEATQRADAEADALLDAGRGPEFEEEAQASQGLADLARMSDAERLEVQRIDAALERLAKGGYGICSACGRRAPDAPAPHSFFITMNLYSPSSACPAV